MMGPCDLTGDWEDKWPISLLGYGMKSFCLTRWHSQARAALCSVIPDPQGAVWKESAFLWHLHHTLSIKPLSVVVTTTLLNLPQLMTETPIFRHHLFVQSHIPVKWNSWESNVVRLQTPQYPGCNKYIFSGSNVWNFIVSIDNYITSAQ